MTTEANVKKVTYKPWVTRGIMLINTFSLRHDDPDHPYNQLVEQGVDPEDFGIKHPLEEEYKNLSRGQLLARIKELEDTVVAYEVWGGR